MKDPTRGGLASALHEMAEKSGVGIVLDETARAGDAAGARRRRAAGHRSAARRQRRQGGDRACARAPPDAVLAALRAHPLGRDAAIVGTCTVERIGAVVLDTGFGAAARTEPEGEPLPRIC